MWHLRAAAASEWGSREALLSIAKILLFFPTNLLPETADYGFSEDLYAPLPSPQSDALTVSKVSDVLSASCAGSVFENPLRTAKNHRRPAGHLGKAAALDLSSTLDRSNQGLTFLEDAAEEAPPAMFLRSRRLLDAERCLRRALASKEVVDGAESESPLLLLAECKRQQGERYAARVFAKKALDESPEKACKKTLFLLAALSSQGEAEDAEFSDFAGEWLEKMAQESGPRALAQQVGAICDGFLEAKVGGKAAAVRWAKRALALRPGSVGLQETLRKATAAPDLSKTSTISSSSAAEALLTLEMELGLPLQATQSMAGKALLERYESVLSPHLEVEALVRSAEKKAGKSFSPADATGAGEEGAGRKSRREKFSSRISRRQKGQNERAQLADPVLRVSESDQLGASLSRTTEVFVSPSVQSALTSADVRVVRSAAKRASDARQLHAARMLYESALDLTAQDRIDIPDALRFQIALEARISLAELFLQSATDLAAHADPRARKERAEALLRFRTAYVERAIGELKKSGERLSIDLGAPEEVGRMGDEKYFDFCDRVLRLLPTKALEPLHADFAAIQRFFRVSANALWALASPADAEDASPTLKGDATRALSYLLLTSPQTTEFSDHLLQAELGLHADLGALGLSEGTALGWAQAVCEHPEVEKFSLAADKSLFLHDPPIELVRVLSADKKELKALTLSENYLPPNKPLSEKAQQRLAEVACARNRCWHPRFLLGRYFAASGAANQAMHHWRAAAALAPEVVFVRELAIFGVVPIAVRAAKLGALVGTIRDCYGPGCLHGLEEIVGSGCGEMQDVEDASSPSNSAVHSLSKTDLRTHLKLESLRALVGEAAIRIESAASSDFPSTDAKKESPEASLTNMLEDVEAAIRAAESRARVCQTEPIGGLQERTDPAFAPASHESKMALTQFRNTAVRIGRF